MDRAGGRLFLWCLGLTAALIVLSLAKGGLYVDRHEGDTLHLIEMVRRMGMGQWPHVDFSTPLGILAFLPISVFVSAGFGVGVSILLGQALVALVLLGPIWWACRSRVGGWAGYALATALIVMTLAMVHGDTGAHVSLSMHYNRWGWVLATLAVMVAALPPRRAASPWIDGVIIGGAMAFFVLGKVTYALAFAPGLIVALGLRKQGLTLAVGVGVVFAVALAFLIFGGIGFWQAYIADLLQVQGSTIRPRAGEDLASLILGPAFIVPNALLAAGVFFLRKSDNPDLGLVLALLTPGFIYVTYQNWGNDPKWLAILAVLLFVGGGSGRTKVLAGLGAILVAPSFANMAISPIRHFLLDSEDFMPAFRAAPHDDFFTPTARVLRVQERRPGQYEDPGFASLNGLPEQNDPVSFKGETFAECRQELGLLGYMQAVADDLVAYGLTSEDAVFSADTFGGYWMFGQIAPTPGGAPWYYGNLTGFAAAEYVLLPICPSTPRAFKAAVQDLEPHTNSLQEVRRNELYVLYEKSEG